MRDRLEKVSELAERAGSWLRSGGPESDVVMSTRIRLARNVEGWALPGRISREDRTELEKRLRRWIGEARVAEDALYCNLETMPVRDRRILTERYLISRELANAEGDRGVTFVRDETLSLMTNEEDHLRLQVVRPGLAVEQTWETATQADRKLEEQIPFAFNERFGYLTACPTNTGTGLRVSIMMHLPALVLSQQMDKVFQAAARVGLTVRGFYGEGTKASGDVIQISNQRTLGCSEDDVISTMSRIVPKIVEYERGVRAHMLAEDRPTMEDKVWRSLGLLRYARKLTSAETLDLLSAVRLGVNLNMIPGISLGEVNELFVITQPAHLQAIRGAELSDAERDVARAAFLRDRFRPESG